MHIIYILYIYIYIRRPRPLPRQGRRLGPPEVWNLALWSQARHTPFQGNSSVSYMPQPSTCSCRTLTPTCPCHLFFRTFKTAVCPASNPPNASAGLQGNNSYSYYMPLPSVFQGVQDCRCPPSNPPNASNPPAGLQGNNSYSYMSLPSVLQGVQDCRLPGLNPPKRFQPSRRPPRQQLLQLHAPAICFSGGSRLPFARPQTPQTLPTLPQASKATTLTATTCPCHLFSGGSRLPFAAPQTPKRFQPSRRPPRQQLLQLHAPAICFSGGSRLPFARPQTPQTLPQASKATTLTATCPCHLFFRGFKTAVCPPSNPPKASAGLQGNNSYYSYAGLQGNNSYSYYMPLPSVFQGVQDCRLPALKPPKRFQPSRRPPRQQLLQLHAPAICFSGGSRLPFARPQTLPNASAGLQGNNSYSYYMPLPSVFQGVQDCRLPALKPPKRFRRPPRQQLLQLHALPSVFQGFKTAVCPPSNPQTLPQASKATTLTATCPCHLFFKGFKTAVCPPSNPPNTSNPPAGLQGNNSDS